MALLNLLSLSYLDFKYMLAVPPLARDMNAPALRVLIIKDGHFISALRAFNLHLLFLVHYCLPRLQEAR